MNERIAQLRAFKSRSEPIAVLTAYDYSSARLLDEAGVDVLLVGDSLGMVVLGYPDTTLVTMDEMLHHTRAVARGAHDGGGKALVWVDLCFGSADTPAEAVRNATHLVQAGAHAVKKAGAFGLLLELVVPAVAATITASVGIPTIGIGAGTDCDGQVLVLHDVIGLYPWFKPKFATQRADVAGEIQRAAREFIAVTKRTP